MADQLAALIGDPPPAVENERDLSEYAEYVETMLGLRQLGGDDVLQTVKQKLATPAEMRATWERMQDAWAAHEHRRDLHAKGAEARRREGASRRAEVAEVYRSLKLTTGSAAPIIAKRLGLSPRQVRRYLRDLEPVPKKKK